VFERYNIVNDSDLASAARRLSGQLGTRESLRNTSTRCPNKRRAALSMCGMAPFAASRTLHLRVAFHSKVMINSPPPSTR
jgi:hypothetical protein